MSAVLEGDVIEMTYRRRNRNAVRDVALLPPSVEAKAAALAPFDQDTQVRAVSKMLSHAAIELGKATDAQSVREWKAKAGAIEELARELHLGKALQLDATEFVRRTERALGIAIRQGQECGEILSRGEAEFRGNQFAKGDIVSSGKKSPTDFASKDELATGKNGIYAITDGVTDEQFESALQAARAEGKLTRANLVRNLKLAQGGQDTNEPPLEPQPTPEPKRRLTKHDSTEMLANISGMLNGIVEALPFIDPADIDYAANKAVITNIGAAMAKIRALLKGIKK